MKRSLDRSRLGAVGIFLLLPILLSAQKEESYHADLLEGSELLAESYYLLIRNYAVELDPLELAHAGVRGMTDMLDRYTAYVTEEENRRLPSSSPTIGIGLDLIAIDGGLLVTDLTAGGPAERAGVRPGDRVVGVDAIAEPPLRVVEEMIATGEVGSRISLVVRRGERTLTIPIERDRLVQKSLATMRRLSDSILYIRIDRFGDDLAADFRRGVLRVGRYEARTAPLRGLVIDLRGNLGGYIEPAVEVAKMLLPSGSAVARIENGRGYDPEVYIDTDPDLLAGLPILLLVDRETASSAELFAAALAENRRAVILGEGTFGKGLVQESDQLSVGGYLRTTTGWYRTPSGVSPDRGDRELLMSDSLLGSGGLTPDSLIADEDILYLTELRRADLFLRFLSGRRGGEDVSGLLPAFRRFVLANDPALQNLRGELDAIRRGSEPSLAESDGWGILLGDLEARRGEVFDRHAAAIGRGLAETLLDMERSREERDEMGRRNDRVIQIGREMIRRLSNEREEGR